VTGLPKELTAGDLMAILGPYGAAIGGAIEYTDMGGSLDGMGRFCTQIIAKIEEMKKKNKKAEIKEDILDKAELRRLKLFSFEVDVLRWRLELPEPVHKERKSMFGRSRSPTSPTSPKSPTSPTSPTAREMFFGRPLLPPDFKLVPRAPYIPPAFPNPDAPEAPADLSMQQSIEVSTLRSYDDELKKIHKKLVSRPVTPHAMHQVVSHLNKAHTALEELMEFGLAEQRVGLNWRAKHAGDTTEDEKQEAKQQSCVTKEPKQGKTLSISTGCGVVFFLDPASVALAIAGMDDAYIQGPMQVSSKLRVVGGTGNSNADAEEGPARSAQLRAAVSAFSQGG
jgi:hypothetical protein